jgi:hypothetical protein
LAASFVIVAFGMALTSGAAINIAADCIARVVSRTVRSGRSKCSSVWLRSSDLALFDGGRRVTHALCRITK